MIMSKGAENTSDKNLPSIPDLKKNFFSKVGK